MGCHIPELSRLSTWVRLSWRPAGVRGGECPLLVSLDLVSGLAQKTTCELAITRSDYRTMPIKSGHPVCAALTPPVGADWYWTLAAVPGK
jgi:hypothetical protein